jgi:hypothetical protein
MCITRRQEKSYTHNLFLDKKVIWKNYVHNLLLGKRLCA